MAGFKAGKRQSSTQWRRLHRAQRARAPTFTNGWARRAPWVEEQHTINWPNCADHHESAHQHDYLYLYSQKSGGALRKIFRCFAPGVCPPPNFHIRSGATGSTHRHRPSHQTVNFFISPSYEKNQLVVSCDTLERRWSFRDYCDLSYDIAS